ncbi:hypothetical protein FRB99_007312 [Tulasnella sp. 403]|nr:hypothetical protein FRB99_007312 [Tulasnella sp. 403]
MQLLHEIATLKRQRNTLVPLHRLPPEIFMSILALAVETGSAYDSLRQMAGVCKSWHKVVVNDPMLWSTINICTVEDKTRIPLFLRKSGNSLLRFDSSFPLRDLPRADREMLLQNSYRWKTLCITLRVGGGPANLQSLSAPHLEYLKILGRNARSTQDAPISGLPETSSLKLLDLDSVYMTSWYFPHSLSSLHTLRITCYAIHFPPPALFVTILKSLPNLVSLTLRPARHILLRGGGDPPISSDMDYMNGPTLCPNLQYVRINGIPRDLVAMLAKRLSIAKCRVICIEPLPPPFAQRFLDTDLARTVRKFNVLIKHRAQHVSPSLREGPRVLKVEDGSNKEVFSISMSPSNEQFLGEAITLANMLRTLPTEVPMDVCLDLDYPHPSLVTELLQLMNRTIHLECDILAVKDLLEIPQNDGTWLLPDLASLTLRNEFNHLVNETLHSFVTKRWRDMRSPGVLPPRRLQRLSFRTQGTIDEQMMGIIQAFALMDGGQVEFLSCPWVPIVFQVPWNPVPVQPDPTAF